MSAAKTVRTLSSRGRPSRMATKLGGHRHLAVGVGVQLRDDFLGMDATGELDLDLHVVGGEVMDGCDLHLPLLRRGLDGLDQRVRRRPERKLADDDGLVALGLQCRSHR